MQDLANFLQDLKSGFCYYQNKSLFVDFVRSYKSNILQKTNQGLITSC